MGMEASPRGTSWDEKESATFELLCLLNELLEDLGIRVNLGPSTSAGALMRADVLDALNDYRAAETAMLRRTRAARGHGETDALALRYLQDASRRGEGLRPTELAHRLGLSTASVTSLVDRLVRSGLVRRVPHPSDRRSTLLHCAEDRPDGHESPAEMNKHPMMDVLDGMSFEQMRTIQDFLQRMRQAVDQVGRD
jgi:DNA-binding MarR family transcriptional regulator